MTAEISSDKATCFMIPWVSGREFCQFSSAIMSADTITVPKKEKKEKKEKKDKKKRTIDQVTDGKEETKEEKKARKAAKKAVSSLHLDAYR